MDKSGANKAGIDSIRNMHEITLTFTLPSNSHLPKNNVTKKHSHSTTMLVFFCNIIFSNITISCKLNVKVISCMFLNLQLMLLFLFTGFFHQIEVRQNKYLNNIVEQDHRFIKKITKPMKGFKSLDSAVATISGIELHHMLRKQQHTKEKSMNIFEQFYDLAA